MEVNIPFRRYYEKYDRPTIRQYFDFCKSIATVVYKNTTYTLCAETSPLQGWIYVLEHPGIIKTYHCQGRLCVVNGDLEKSGWSGSFQQKYPYTYDMDYLEKELKNKFFDYLKNKQGEENK